RGTSKEQDRVPVPGAAGADQLFRLRDSSLEPGLPVGRPGRHAERPVDDEDVVRPRGDRDRVELTGSDPLPPPLGPVGGGGHREERQKQDKSSQGQKDPLVDAPPVPPLGLDEEADRGPRDDLVAFAKEQVKEDRQADRDDAGSGGEGRTEHGKKRRAWGRN